MAKKERIIEKYFKTLKQAEDYLFDLYDEYETASCVNMPFGEAGIYTFKVTE